IRLILYLCISPVAQKNNPMYEFVFGGWGNTRSAIRDRSQGPSLADAEGEVLLGIGSKVRVWVRVQPMPNGGSEVSMGTMHSGVEHVLCTYRRSTPLFKGPMHIGLMTGYGLAGNWSPVQ
ncbi:hypothetical protein KIPB_007563, partial [Kipferlia bialata]